MACRIGLENPDGKKLESLVKQVGTFAFGKIIMDLESRAKANEMAIS